MIVEKLLMMKEEGGYLYLLLSIDLPKTWLYDVGGYPIIETYSLSDLEIIIECFELGLCW